MIIRFLIGIAILLPYSLKGQAEKSITTKGHPNLIEKLQGKWNCIAVLNHEVNLKTKDYAGSSRYLRFHFDKNRLYVSEAPFDIGYRATLKIKKNSILVTEQNNLTEYEVGFISTDSLVLILRGAKVKDSDITYYFKRTINEGTEYSNKVVQYSFALIIFDIKNNFRALKSISDSSVYPKTDFHYLNSNQSEFYFSSPLFIQNEGKNFATSFLINFDRMKANDVDSLNNELVIEFDVYNKKISGINILNNISYQLSSHVFEILTKNQKYWRVTNETNGSRVRFSFSIFRGNIRDFSLGH